MRQASYVLDSGCERALGRHFGMGRSAKPLNSRQQVSLLYAAIGSPSPWMVRTVRDPLNQSGRLESRVKILDFLKKIPKGLAV